MSVRVIELDARTDDRGASFNVPLPFTDFRECHAATVRPGAIRGNHFHRTRREFLLVLYSDSWTLLWDRGEHTPVEQRTFTGTGAVLMEAPPLCAHAVRNDGNSELQIFSLGDVAEDETVRRVLT
jgi:dTDP-4-dehydrorhamnose 3,5-epimerase-like enzyme